MMRQKTKEENVDTLPFVNFYYLSRIKSDKTSPWVKITVPKHRAQVTESCSLAHL